MTSWRLLYTTCYNMVRHVTTYDMLQHVTTCYNNRKYVTTCYNYSATDMYHCEQQKHVKHDAAQIHQQNRQTACGCFWCCFGFVSVFVHVCASLIGCSQTLSFMCCLRSPSGWHLCVCVCFYVLWSCPVTACHNMPRLEAQPWDAMRVPETRNKKRRVPVVGPGSGTHEGMPGAHSAHCQTCVCRTTPRNSQAFTGHFDQAFKAWQILTACWQQQVPKGSRGCEFLPVWSFMRTRES